MPKLKRNLIATIKNLNLLDDTFMTKFFEDDIERTQFVLRILLENDRIKVKKTSTQI